MDAPNSPQQGSQFDDNQLLPADVNHPSASEVGSGSESEFDLDVFFESLSGLEKNDMLSDKNNTAQPTDLPSIESQPLVDSLEQANAVLPPQQLPPLRVIHSHSHWKMKKCARLNNINKSTRARFFSALAKQGLATGILFALGMLLGWIALRTPAVLDTPTDSVPIVSATTKNHVEPIIPAKSLSTNLVINSNSIASTGQADQLFALQVAACRSEICLARYRKLLALHVSANKVQIRQSRNLKQLRVGPFAKSEAQSLKDHFASEPSLAQAYLVKLR